MFQWFCYREQCFGREFPQREWQQRYSSTWLRTMSCWKVFSSSLAWLLQEPSPRTFPLLKKLLITPSSSFLCIFFGNLSNIYAHDILSSFLCILSFYLLVCYLSRQLSVKHTHTHTYIYNNLKKFLSQKILTFKLWSLMD